MMAEKKTPAKTRAKTPAKIPAKAPEPPTEITPRPRNAGKIIEKMLENPTLVIAGLAAVPLLFLAWGLTRRRRRRRRDEEILEDESY